MDMRSEAMLTGIRPVFKIQDIDIDITQARTIQNSREDTIMTDMDLSAMTLDELKKLHKEITQAITSYEERKRNEALAVLEAKANEMGFRLADLTGMAAKSKPASIPKYAHPENPSITWTGRGRRPAWITEALDAGRSLDEFLIAKK
jgi:DNA-binding protein H-NS